MKGGVFPPRCHVYFGRYHTPLGQGLTSVSNLWSSGCVPMEVQPLVRASIERPRRTEPKCVAPLNGANTICTNKCRPEQTLEMEREQLSNASLHNNILYICPDATFIGINERKHCDGDLQKHRATHVQKACPSTRATCSNSLMQNSSGICFCCKARHHNNIHHRAAAHVSKM